ncbi:hypothetical protein WK03_35555 [Burkholderia cepacia]|uniref:tape measure protein n=1 Tax=Burkholderia cepacia TaxID=292 RepID=UPI000755C5CE|nr:tape measure protein [Burkholderia cepacia]KVQ35787.1 hypothetical protein WK03_35555 [Burkholderia cepacia]
MNGLGDIGYNLILDDSGFRVTARATHAQLQALERQFASTGQAVEALQGSLSKAGGSFHSFVATVGAVKFAMLDVHGIFLALPAGIMETSGQIERLTKVLEGLSTASTDAKRQLDALRGVDFILGLEQRVPFSMQSLTDMFVKLKTVGIDPARGAAEALTNEVAKFGGGSLQLKEASLAIQQMLGKGSVSLQELRMQLSQAVPNAAQKMADAMGLSMDQLIGKIKKGSVEASSAVGKMLAAFNLDSLGAGAAQMETWLGLQEKLGTQWELWKKSVGDAGFFDAAKKSLSEMVDVFHTSEAKTWAHDLSDGLVGAIKAGNSLVSTVVEYKDQLKLAAEAAAALGAVMATKWVLGGVAGAAGSFVGSFRQFATDSLATENLVAQKRISLSEQIRAEDAKRIAMIQAESIARQEALAAEIAGNQRLIVENDKRYAAIDARRQAEIAGEIAANEQILAAKVTLLAELEAREVAATAFVAAEQDKRLAMSMASNSATAAQYAAQAKFTQEVEGRLASMRAEIALLTEEEALLRQRIATLNAVSVAERETAIAQGQLNAATSAENAILVEKNALLAATIAEERVALTAVQQMTTAQVAWKEATLGLQFAFNALGGWLTVLAGAIIGGIALWNSFAEAAKRAANAAIDAANIKRSIAQGAVAQGDLDRQDGHIADQKNKIADLQNEIAIAQKGRRVDSGWEAADPQRVQQLKTQLAQEQAALSELVSQRAAAKKVLDASDLDANTYKYQTAYQRETDAKVAAIAKSGQNEVSAIKDKYDAIKKASGKGLSEEQQQAQGTEVAAAIKKGTEAIAKAYDARDAELRQKIKAVSGPDAEMQRAALQKELERVRQEGENQRSTFVAAMNSPNVWLDANKKKGGAARPPTDKLANRLGDLNVQIADAKGKLAQVVEGATEYDQLRAQAQEKVSAMIDAGKLNFVTHGKGGTSTKADINSEMAQRLVDQMTLLEILKNGRQQMQQLNARIAPLKAEYAQGMDQIAQGDFTTPTGKNDNSMLSFLEKLSTRSLEAAKDLAPLVDKMKEAQRVADQVDLMNFTRNVGKQMQTDQLSLIDGRAEKLQAQWAIEDAAWRREAADRLNKVAKQGQDVSEEQSIIDAADLVRAKKHARDLETPMQQLVTKWQQATDTMQQASVNWSNNTIDAFVNAAKTGRFEWQNLMEGIVADTLKASLQKKIGSSLQVGYDWLANGIGKLLGGNATPAPITTQGSAGAGLGMAGGLELQTSVSTLARGFTNLATSSDKWGFSLADNVKGMLTGQTAQVTANNSLMTLANAAQIASSALAQMAGGSAGGGGLGGLFGALGSVFGLGGSSGASSAAAGSASSWGVGSNSFGFTMPAFANGGVMTQFGVMNLRKYANGGIANSPQMAIYGEGSSPEAFVPLPDGRSIPVTMRIAAQQQSGGQGAGASAVTVNVINQTGQQVQAQQGNTRFDGKQMILDVVLSAATTPGGFRDQMRGAMK